MPSRADLIAKLRHYLWDGYLIQDALYVGLSPKASLSQNEIDRLISDLEFCDFAHKMLEGDETLKKQAG